MQQKLTSPRSFLSYSRLNPFQRSKKTWATLFIELEPDLSSTMLNILGAVVFQQDTQRRKHPFTYMEMGLRIQQKRNTIAWNLHYLHRKGLIQKGKHKEKYSQKNGFTGKTAICERIRTIQLPSDDLVARKKALEEEFRKEIIRIKKERIAHKRKKREEEKERKQKELRNTTPRRKPPASFRSNKASREQVTPNLRVLEALFEKNKIRSYKLDGDMRCRRYMAKTLKGIKMADLLLAVALFVQNRFLMDANAHGWMVARANALRTEGKEPFVNGKKLNLYKNWCPSMIWFVANIQKILEGAYQPKTQETRDMERKQRQLEMDFTIHAESKPSVSRDPSPESLALIEKKKLEQEEEDQMQLQAKMDREATHRAKPYWASLGIEERQKLETSFIEAIKKGETALAPDTNVADFLFKMIKESMLLTWLGYKMGEETRQ